MTMTLAERGRTARRHAGQAWESMCGTPLCATTWRLIAHDLEAAAEQARLIAETLRVLGEREEGGGGDETRDAAADA